MSVSHDTKVDLVIDMIEYFRAGGTATTAELATRWGISQRTAQRYIYSVERHVPLITEPEPVGRWATLTGNRYRALGGQR